MTGFDDFAPRTTSSSRITFAGEKKCQPITLSGRFVPIACDVTDEPGMVRALLLRGICRHVLVAPIQPGDAERARPARPQRGEAVSEAFLRVTRSYNRGRTAVPGAMRPRSDSPT